MADKTTVVDICSECSHAVDVAGAIGCAFVGVWRECGGVRRLVVRPCLLGQRQRNLAMGCANPETPGKWDGAERPFSKPRSADKSNPGKESDAERRARACHGHGDGRAACPHCDGAFCTEGVERRRIRLGVKVFCRIGRWGETER